MFFNSFFGSFRCWRGDRVLLVLILGMVMGPAAAQSLWGFSGQPEVAALSAVLMNPVTGEMLFAKDPHRRLPPASTTKVLTALVALERLNPRERVLVSPQAASAPPSRIGLRAGEAALTQDLLYGLLLKSGNDAAETLAEAAGGSVAGFARLMNARAMQIGAHDSYFANPHGLPDENHYSTAYDLALIFSHAIKNPRFADIVGTRNAALRIETGDGMYSDWRTVSVVNHNRLLTSYQGTIGGKTGYTTKARRCFVGEVERNGVRLVVAILNSPSSGTLWRDARTLLDYGFSRYGLASPPALQPEPWPILVQRDLDEDESDFTFDAPPVVARASASAAPVRVAETRSLEPESAAENRQIARAPEKRSLESVAESSSIELLGETTAPVRVAENRSLESEPIVESRQTARLAGDRALNSLVESRPLAPLGEGSASTRVAETRSVGLEPLPESRRTLRASASELADEMDLKEQVAEIRPTARTADIRWTKPLAASRPTPQVAEIRRIKPVLASGPAPRAPESRPVARTPERPTEKLVAAASPVLDRSPQRNSELDKPAPIIAKPLVAPARRVGAHYAASRSVAATNPVQRPVPDVKPIIAMKPISSPVAASQPTRPGKVNPVLGPVAKPVLASQPMRPGKVNPVLGPVAKPVLATTTPSAKPLVLAAITPAKPVITAVGKAPKSPTTIVGKPLAKSAPVVASPIKREKREALKVAIRPELSAKPESSAKSQKIKR